MPAKLLGRTAIFAGQGFGHVNFSEAGFQVLVMQGFDFGDVLPQFVPDVGRQHGGAILAALAAAHKKEVLAEIDILDAQPHAFHQAQTGPVKQFCHEGMSAI